MLALVSSAVVSAGVVSGVVAVVSAAVVSAVLAVVSSAVVSAVLAVVSGVAVVVCGSCSFWCSLQLSVQL